MLTTLWCTFSLNSPSGISYLGNNASRADGAAISDGDAGQNDYVPCYPAVLADGDGSAQLGSIGAIAKVRVEGVRAAEQGDVGPDQGPRSNAYLAGVQDGAVEVDEHITSHFDVAAVVDVDRPLDPWVLVQDGVFLALGRRWWW